VPQLCLQYSYRNSILTCESGSRADSILKERALSESPNGYTPSRGPCPNVPPSIRSPFDISPQEAIWLKKRRQNIVQPMRDFLRRANITNFDSDAYMNKVSTDDRNLPTIGIAISGGGYRALLIGAGALAAFDDRTHGSTEPGNLGGLLQASTYISGLSGGGWLVGSVFVNNFTSVENILAHNTAGHGTVWHFGRPMLEGPKSETLQSFPGLSTLDYWSNIINQVKGKKNAGFRSSLTDYWSRALSYQMVNATQGGPGKLCSLKSSFGCLNRSF
jgi:lysophospholipase